MRANTQTVSLFCGGGGETAGKLLAFRELGIEGDAYDTVAVNHWELAVLAHGRNFPSVRVVQEDIHDVTAADFGLDTIDLLWASPSCVHHSRARGGKPREDQQRAHAWEVVDRWLRVADVRVLLIENVPEFAEWGPLDDDGQPVKARRGEFFANFVSVLRALGYEVDWRVLCAADYGDPTIRKRLFLQAAKDGQIAWPEPTHRDPSKPVDLWNAHLRPWRTAAECIDWSIPVPSIFGRKRELADATKRRIAHGVARYVLQGRPFIVNMAHGGKTESVDRPFSTVATEKGGCRALVAPTLVQTGYGERDGQAPRSLDLNRPLGTVAAGGCKHALVAAFLAKHYGGVVGQRADHPLGTVTVQDHHAVVTAALGDTADAGAGRVAAFLMSYYTEGGNARSLGEPLAAVTTKARHGLVTVDIEGETFALVDIGMRMLDPRELARAMGFPDWYEFATPNGAPMSKRDAIKLIGNACPVGTVKELIKAVVLRRPEAFGLGAAA